MSLVILYMNKAKCQMHNLKVSYAKIA